jgi:hypothetical protein
MTDLARPAGTSVGLLRPADGLRLLGEYQGSGFTEPRFLVRRADGQVIQLSRLLYLVAEAIAEGGTGDGTSHHGWDAGQVAARAGASFGREITADNVRYLVTGKLAPLGVVVTGEPPPQPQSQTQTTQPQTQAAQPDSVTQPGALGQPGHGAQPHGAPAALPRSDLLLGLKVRGVLLRPRAANAVGRALAWLHYPALAGMVLATFGVFEVWLFAGHGAIGPLLDVERHPVLLLAVAGLTLASLLFHEFGHASACRYGGARPGAIGFGLYLVWPSLYTDVTDVYRLGRAGRLRTDLGGVYFNAIFILILGACYAVTGQPVFLAAAFVDNIQILQQLAPLVRMDGYFILGDLAGVPDLFGLLGPIMASLAPGTAARRAGARARGLRRGPRVLVTVWVLVAVPLLLALAGYTLWHLPSIVSTAARSFSSGLAAARAGFAAGHPATGLAAGFSTVLLLLPLAGLAYLITRIAARGARALGGLARHSAMARPQRLTVVLAALCATAIGAGATLAALAVVGTGASPGAGAAASASRAQAAEWVAQQVDPDVTVACDPAMCGQVRSRGFPAARLAALTATAGNPLSSALVVVTPVLQQQFGTRLASVDAPVVIAAFGSGAGQVQVRAVAPDGPAAFRSALAANHATLVSAGGQLLDNRNISFSPSARTALQAGQADSRLLVTLSVLASQMPIRLVALDGRPPGASSGVPLRSAEIGAATPSARSAVLAFLRAQLAPYRPAATTLTSGPGGQPMITVRFDVPAQPAAG